MAKPDLAEFLGRWTSCDNDVERLRKEKYTFHSVVFSLFHQFYDEYLSEKFNIVPKRLKRKRLTNFFISYETGYAPSHPADPSLMYLYNLVPKDQKDWVEPNPHPEHLEFKQEDRTTVWDWHKNVAAQIGVLHSPSENKQIQPSFGSQKPYLYIKIWGEVPKLEQDASYRVEKQEAFGKPYSILWITGENASMRNIRHSLTTALLAAKPFILSYKEYWGK